MNDQQLRNHLLAMDEAQMRQVLARVLMEIDSEAGTIDSQQELDFRLNQDTLLLRDMASSLQLPGQLAITKTKDEASVDLLLFVSRHFPQYQQTLVDAIGEAMEPDVQLDFGLSIALGALVIAMAAAITRPHVVVEEKREKTKNEEKVERKVEIKMEGISNIAQVIKIILPFL